MPALRTDFSGRSLIGFREASSDAEPFFAWDPTTGEKLEPVFTSATVAEVDQAARLASQAFAVYSHISGRERGALLRTIAANIETIASEIVDRAHRETALPLARLQSEMTRTCGQLRLFAQVAEEESWVQARIDRAQPERKPISKPDLRSMLRPLGPVAVFGASNFPLAFSVAGGDTASALAAGNPVIVKAHPAHPGTSELVGRAIQESVRECRLPEGIFSLLHDAGTLVGVELVKHPLIKAGGFTGSRAAGRILMDLAAARPEPIPFFAEMSSTNPLFILPGALRERGETIATGLHTSFTMGAGQFCTKPGMVFLPQGVESDAFSRKLQELMKAPGSFHLLTKGICASYSSALKTRSAHSAIKSLSGNARGDQALGFSAQPALFHTDAQSFINSDLADEIFGPTTLLVEHSTREQVLKIARCLEGHLTATIHGTEEDLREFADLVAILENKVGRLIFNGFPTGVEVTHAMVHGGPYPATSDGRSTSVGSQAIFRFARPVCFQGFPDSALPNELKNANPLGIWRMLDGQMSRGPIA
jgi:NADP-dependent aldehyde dehydrogenase